MIRKILLLVLIAFGHSSVYADVKEYSVEEIKTAYIYNFLQIIEWPSLPKDKIVVGILSKGVDSKFLKTIQSLSNQSAQDRKIEVKIFDTLNEILLENTLDVILLFLNGSFLNKKLGYFSQLEARSILTIGDDSDFISEGGMIAFVERDNKVLFEINVDQASKAHIRIPSKLIRLAANVNE